MQDESLTLDQLSMHVGEVISGTVFLVTGLIVAFISVMRRGKGGRILIWLAAWSGMYGTRLLVLTPPVRIQLPQWIEAIIPHIDVLITYLILIFALLTWWDLTRGELRRFLQLLLFAAVVVGVADVGWFIISGVPDTFILATNLLAAAALLIVVVVILTRRLSETYLVLPNRGVLAAGTLIFVGEALYSHLSWFFGYPTWTVLGWFGFAALLFSLAFVAAKMTFASERRLIAIENELETARQIQTSILPARVPEVTGISVAASYYPMNAVAGDFYDYIQVNQHQAGFLIADVSGHGVPSALISSMIKVAMHSVTDSAGDPKEVLGRLRSILGKQLHDGKFVTAAYLYLDSESGRAHYSAAGHPPLLYWNSASQHVELIESNGLLIGFMDETAYPVREIAFSSGDRFILYTDGLTEAENAAGELFGDYRLGEFLRVHTDVAASELNEKLFSELQAWQHSQIPQHDDITWIIIDVE